MSDQRAAVDLCTIQLWVRDCFARNVSAGTGTGFSASAFTGFRDEGGHLEDLTSTSMDLIKRQVKTLADKVNINKSFTPRADKANMIGRGGGGDGRRFVAKDLPTGSNWPQKEHQKRKIDRRPSSVYAAAKYKTTP
ncbi:hypothetical protein CYMTET_30691 [Cymbomonas tetramitiformis]|uniref:Uncharacterized protein n=1 Tax=Cymbomonas tetramitiformis TaxID=36881 RepID=A0AAE0FJU9_9CHLO|nr:hypothetical protein CYMTET_30691 [Cymbomonas tetramitiformis]